MDKLIERIKKSVEFAEKEGENMDDVSWGMEEGMLISYNEAKQIIALIEWSCRQLKPLVSGSLQRKCTCERCTGIKLESYYKDDNDR